MSTAEKRHPTCYNHYLTNAELEEVSGGGPSLPANAHHLLSGTASDLIFGDKALIWNVIRDATAPYR